MASAEPDSLTERRPGISLPIEVTALTAILALALALMAGAGAALYQKTRPANYISIGVVLIDQPVVVANDPSSGPLLKLQTLRLLYAGLIKTETITSPVSRQVQLPIGRVANDLSAIADPTSFNIDIIATAKSPTEALTVAQAGTAQLISYVDKSQAHIGVIPQNRVVLTELTAPHAGVRVSVSTTKILLPAGIAFIVVGGAFLIVADLLRRRW
jgi:uncharacterized protein involved in exopolysaccharide biosynthesis